MSRLSQKIQYLFFVFWAACCLPLSSVLLALNVLYISLNRSNSLRRYLQNTPGFVSRAVLLSGINTPQGLRLARAFHETGHTVIGADYEPGEVPIHVRFSKAVGRFYRLQYNADEEKRALAYIASLVEIVKKDKVDVWINCTTGADPTTEAQARKVIERTTDCRCFALRLNDTPYYTSRDSFLLYAKSLGLAVPEMYHVKSRDEIHNVLNKAHGNRTYLLHSPIQQAHSPTTPAKTLLPRRTLSQTYNTVSRIPIAKTTVWRLDQDISGLPTYSTFAVIVRGRVTAFVASSSSDHGDYEPVEAESALSQSMLQFVQVFARKQGVDFNTHLGMKLCVEEQVMETRIVRNLLLVEGSVQSQASALLFRGLGGSIQLTRAYLACLSPPFEARNGDAKPAVSNTRESVQAEAITPVFTSSGVYSFGQDLFQLAVMPLIACVTFRGGLEDCFVKLFIFLKHLFLWHDDTYARQDPLPFWWSYQIYIPLRFVMAALSLGTPGGQKQLGSTAEPLDDKDGLLLGTSRKVPGSPER